MIYKDLCSERVSMLGFGTMRLPVVKDSPTHDIDEAIYLSDRILVFGGSPAVIRAEISINEKNRTRDWLYDQSELRRKLHGLIRGAVC